MEALFVVLLGVAIVVVGVLLFRLHAFLALILAALTVGVLTPQAAVTRSILAEQVAQQPIRVLQIDAGANTLRVASADAAAMTVGSELAVLRLDHNPWKWHAVGRARVSSVEPAAEPGQPAEATAHIVWQGEVGLPSRDDWVVPQRELQQAESIAQRPAPERLASGFGDTAAAIGILIAMAAIVGKCLLDSGAADRIVRSMLRLAGEPGAPKAFVASGFLLGIPVFFDTVFYLLLPLGKALRLRTGRNYLLYVLSIVAGATMAHSLVPPTPGPLFVAKALGIDLGLTILVGCAVGAGAAAIGYGYATWLSRRHELPLRETPDMPVEPVPPTADAPESSPSLVLSLLPILLPLVLIVGREVLNRIDGVPPAILRAANVLGNVNVALMFAAAAAMAALLGCRRPSRADFAASLQTALAGAGVIILITSAGGAFGRVIQQTGLAALVGQLPVHSTPAILTLAFLITTAIRTAQGSATIAMITASGIIAPLATAGTLAFHPVWLAAAIGCGSKPFSWMNDSGFWVISRMSGMTEVEALKYVTSLLAVMGFAGLLLTVSGAVLFPMAQ